MENNVNVKQEREIELRQAAYGLAQELTIASNQAAFMGATGAVPKLPDTKGVIDQAKLIYDYFVKGK